MKTYKHLFPQICEFENLYQAFLQARKGKRRHPTVASFEFNLEENLLRLQAQLQNGTWQPGQYTHFTIYDHKPRRISAAPFADRIVHHALINVIGPIWENRFIHDSYACRAGKGTHAALDRSTAFARRYPYVLQCDVVQFFPSVDHAILVGLLARYLADQSALDLCCRILASGADIHRQVYEMQWFPGDDIFAPLRGRGLPIGNQTSQFWANVYLHELDLFAKQELGSPGQRPAYLRYADDMLLFAADKPTLHQWRREIETFLETLRLIIHPRQSRVYPVTCGIPFLGFTVYPDHRRLRRSAGLAFQRRFKRKLTEVAAGHVSLASLHNSVRGWLGHVRHGDTYGLRRTILSQNLILDGSML
mgnify:FL=1